MPAEINTPITVRMTDHNLQDEINQCNTGYYTNGSHETFFLIICLSSVPLIDNPVQINTVIIAKNKDISILPV